MRTTLSIDDELLERARARARQQGTSLGRIIERALRRDLATEPAAVAPVVSVFDGGTGLVPGVDLTSNRAIAELLDDGQPIERRR